jgi:hypothetical protein
VCALKSSITMNAVEVSVEVVNSDVLIVHDLGFESLSFWAHQWWCSAWSWVRTWTLWESMMV